MFSGDGKDINVDDDDNDDDHTTAKIFLSTTTFSSWICDGISTLLILSWCIAVIQPACALILVNTTDAVNLACTFCADTQKIQSLADKTVRH